MLPDRVSNPEPLTYKPGALPIALRGPATLFVVRNKKRIPLNIGKNMIAIHISLKFYHSLQSSNFYIGFYGDIMFQKCRMQRIISVPDKKGQQE